MLAVLTVNSTADYTPDALTLRAAIYLINDPSLRDSVATDRQKLQVLGTLGVPGTPDVIRFNLPWGDSKQYYYKDNLAAGRVSLAMASP